MSSMFNAMDANGDGVVTRAEFQNAMAPQAPIQYGAPQASYAPATQMGAPQMTYGAPQNFEMSPNMTYAAPQPQMTYAAPQPQYVPQESQITYAAPQAQMTYAAPQPQISYAPPQQYAAPQMGFNQLDTNGDGVITRQEMAQASYAQPQISYAAPQPQVTYAAPQPQMTYAAPQPQYAAPQMGFNQLDRDGDGVITRQEFAQASQVQTYAAPQVQTYAAPVAQQQMQYAAPSMMAPLPTTYGVQGTFNTPAPQMTYGAPQPQMTYAAPQPQISYAAPQQYAAPQMGFNQLDTNGDGVITRQEMAQAMQPQMQQSQVTYAAPQPQMMQPQMTYAAPQPQMQAAQMSYGGATQVMTYGAPQQQAQPQYAQAQSAFNTMDRNGDGVVTRQEFAQMR